MTDAASHTRPGRNGRGRENIGPQRRRHKVRSVAFGDGIEGKVQILVDVENSRHLKRQAG